MTFWQNTDFLAGGAQRRPQNNWQKAVKSYSGAPARNRTWNLVVKSHLLYQLSYEGMHPPPSLWFDYEQNLSRGVIFYTKFKFISLQRR